MDTIKSQLPSKNRQASVPNNMSQDMQRANWLKRNWRESRDCWKITKPSWKTYARRSASNAVLHMSWTQFNQLGSCEARRSTLILFGAAEAFFTPGQPRITLKDRLWVKPRSSHESNQTHNQRSKCVILTLPWKTTEQDRFCYLFGVADRFDWIKFDVWLKQAFF